MNSMYNEAMANNAKAAAGPNMDKVKELFPIGSECTCDIDGLYGETLTVIGHDENMMGTPIIDVRSPYGSKLGYYAHELTAFSADWFVGMNI